MTNKTDVNEGSAALHCPTDVCFVCGVQFDQSFVGGPRDWPGTIFEATGNWGSTIYDPTPNVRPACLAIRICDKCVITNRARIEETGDHLPESLRDDVSEYFAAKGSP